MKNDPMSWLDEQEKRMKEEKSDGYFSVVEGDNRFQLLTHCAPLPQKWTGTKYEVAQEGDTGISIKGVCWVLQDGKIKQAKLPYTAVKQIRELQNDPDYAFEEFPMPRAVNLKTKGAGEKTVEYTVIPSPKETPIPQDIRDELAKKPTPEQVVEKLKGKEVASTKPADDYPITEGEIPF